MPTRAVETPSPVLFPQSRLPALQVCGVLWRLCLPLLREPQGEPRPAWKQGPLRFLCPHGVDDSAQKGRTWREEGAGLALFPALALYVSPASKQGKDSCATHCPSEILSGAPGRGEGVEAELLPYSEHLHVLRWALWTLKATDPLGGCTEGGLLCDTAHWNWAVEMAFASSLPPFLPSLLPSLKQTYIGDCQAQS